MTIEKSAIDPNHSSARNGQVPSNLLYAGVVVGLVLIFLGIGLLSFGRGSLLSSLMTCVGFGIVLASFGATASGSWAGWTITGAGGLSIALFLILQQYQPSPTPPLYKKGQLRGDLSKIADLRIVDDLPMYLYRDRTTSSIRFIMLEKRLKSARLSIQVDTTEKGQGREFFELIGDAQAIEKRYLSEDQGHRQIQWTFEYDRRVVLDGADVVFSERGSLPERLFPVSTSTGWLPDFDIQIAKAFAEEAKNHDVLVDDLVAKLRSNDTAVRRNARDDLASLGPGAVGAMMSALQANASNYRVRLGVLYALSEMLRRNPNQRSAISSGLKDSDFPLLVSAASDDDKTIRLQAASFLYLLQDSRSIPASIEAARATNDRDKTANQIIIIGNSSRDLSMSEKEKVVRELSVGSNNSLIRDSDLLRRKLGF